jgi:plasmid stabilization system protein ParE
MRLEYSSAAVGDLARLREFIAIHNPEAAKRISD